MTNEEIQQEIERLRQPDILNLEQVKRFSAWLDERRKLRKPGRAVGESGLGKTTASLFYTYQNRAAKIPNQNPVAPVLYVELIGSSCSPSLLFKTIIETLKFKAKGGTEHQLRERAWYLIKQCKVEMLIIDEAHRLQFKTLTDVTDLSDKVKIIPILVGTSSRLDALISKNEQVGGRFAAYFSFETLIGANFTKTVKIWEQQILKLPEPSNLADNQEIITILQAKTAGQIRLLDQILRDAAVKALESGVNKIDKSLLNSIEGDYSLVAS
ncbi:TniB family NTP-binding protein [Aliinostoc sp. HNIBRCY26]|uniref:TniB family NTP-binding protein n=1 Tax=Aliinostoc sp. HNIBRCY26 TaxID=3418997 RepID=UPI003CFD4DBE